ncbi:hypothetical protein GCM10011309_21760 [Litorimonas cladophorae]|uniref:Uncharacterized protein n=1 Tax=Litorimonas cladophorae TaxID=1220491 RepID=A0A918KP44_9PROT|nr:hypothetical protein [Litorimonas cladophorae]GGX71247.1 hypothetical protein GCM10011309_21760 [Litorimonas cladophorae]
MIRLKSTRTSLFIASLAATLAFPAIASAQCGTTQGSFVVTCEQGVQVYRHNALSSIPRGLSQAQVQLKAEKMRQRTEMARIAAKERNQARQDALRQRELDIEDYRVRVEARNLRSRAYVYGNGFGYNQVGSTFARPLRVRKTP